MSEREKIVHVWLELKNNTFEAIEYVGPYDVALSHSGSVSSTFEGTFVFPYARLWSLAAIEKAINLGIKTSDVANIFVLYDENYRKDIPVGYLAQYSTVVYLGYYEFSLPALPKIKVVDTMLKIAERGQITFYGKKYNNDISYLRLAYEPVKSLMEFQIFPNLKSLTLIQHNQDIQIEKIDILILPQLEALFLFGNKISTIQNLHSLTNLKRLGIHNACLEKIENLDDLDNLNELNLSTNQIKIIEGLDGLKNLKKLNLGENQIQKIVNLSPLGNLSDLDLHNNYISEIENLVLLTSLISLNLSSNLITKISGMDYFSFLKNLNLYNNQIAKIENIDNLRNLEKVMLGFNQIIKIENLEGLDKLNWLDLNHNIITKLENLNNLPSLEHLDISENKIIRLENLENLSNLKELHIWGNPIKEITESTYESLAKNLNIKLGKEENEYSSIAKFVNKYEIKIVK